MIYLTPSGRDASEYSTGPNKITYYPMSYDLSDDKPNILSWLKKCLDISKGCPRIHEVIKQYITYIKIQDRLWKKIIKRIIEFVTFER